MKKAIAIIRTSTKAQEIESQKKEVLNWCVKDGLTLEEVEVVGKQGASAIKLDEEYLKNLNRVYELIESVPSIKTVYAFAIDRIGRDEEVLMQLKNRLIRNGVQLKIMNPTLILLNEDGSVNNGVELAFSLFATMAKQEMETKKARFDRARRRNAEQGLYNGGGEIKYGYTVEDKRIVIAEDEANIVRMIYDMMASGNYSYFTLTKEIKDRGITFRGKEITVKTIISLFNTTIYTGKPNGKLGTKYPVIITEEFYNKVKQVISNNNRFQNKEFKHSHFATKILRCSDCGTAYTAVVNNYRCYRRSFTKRYIALGEDDKICHNNISFQIKYLDGYLWSIAQKLHFEYLNKEDDAKTAELTEEKDVLFQKIEELERRIEEVAGRKRANIIDMFAEALISKEERNKRLSKVDEEVADYNKAIATYKQRIVTIDSMLNDSEDYYGYFENANILFEDISSATEKQMSEIVHRYITDVRLERCVMPQVETPYGNLETSKISGKNCIKVTVTTYDNRKVYIYYFSKLTTVANSWWCMEADLEAKDGEQVEPFPFEPIIRKDGRCYTESIELRKAIVSKYAEWWNNETDRRLEKREYICLINEESKCTNIGETGEELKKMMAKLSDYVCKIGLPATYIQTINYLAMRFPANDSDVKEFDGFGLELFKPI